MSRINLAGTICIIIECGTCGVTHAIPAVKYDNCVEEGGFWTCPNGHSRGWDKGRRERDKIERERDILKQQNARLAEEAATAERSRARAVAELQRHKKRTMAGTCPCCRRTFSNMTRHMKTKHPDYNVVALRK